MNLGAGARKRKSDISVETLSVEERTIKQEPLSVDMRSGHSKIGFDNMSAMSHVHVKKTKRTANTALPTGMVSSLSRELSSVYSVRIELLCSGIDISPSDPSKLISSFETAFSNLRTVAQNQGEWTSVIDQTFISCLCNRLNDPINPSPKRLEILSMFILRAVELALTTADAVVKLLLTEFEFAHRSNWNIVCKTLIELMLRISSDSKETIWYHVLEQVSFVSSDSSESEAEQIKISQSLLLSIVQSDGVLQPFIVHTVQRLGLVKSENSSISLFPNLSIHSCVKDFMTAISERVASVQKYVYEHPIGFCNGFHVLSRTRQSKYRKDALADDRWNDIVWNCFSLLKERAPLRFLIESIIENSGNRKDGIIVTHRIAICEAFVMYVLSLPGIEGVTESINEAWKGVWGYWLILADQFNALLIAKLLSLSDFVECIQRKQESYKDNKLIWLISQTMSLDIVKKSFAEDFSKHSGKLAHAVCDFYDHQCSSGNELSKFVNSSLDCYVWRVRSILSSFMPSCDINSFQDSHSEWWKISSNSGIDFYSLSSNCLANVFTLSSISSVAVADKIIEFLEEPVQGQHWTPLPGQLFYSGKSKGLSLNVLFHISAQCRVRVAEHLMKCILSPKESRPCPPCIVETFSRVVFTAPFTMKPHLSSLLEHMGSVKAIALQTILELLEYRLFRVIIKLDMTEKLLKSLMAVFDNVSHPQLMKSVSSLIFKVSRITKSKSEVSCKSPSVSFLLQTPLNNQSTIEQGMFEKAKIESQRPDIASLKGFSNCQFSELKRYLRTGDLVKIRFLSVVACLWLESGESSFFEFNFQQILSDFTPLEIELSTEYLVDTLLQGLDDGVLALDQTISLMEAFLFVHRFAPIPQTLVILCSRKSQYSVSMIKRILLSPSLDLSRRISQLTFPVNFWQGEYLQSHLDYHNTFVELSVASESVLPVYYSNLCLQLLPVFDILLERLVNEQDEEFISKLVVLIQPLFKFHYAPHWVIQQIMKRAPETCMESILNHLNQIVSLQSFHKHDSFDKTIQDISGELIVISKRSYDLKSPGFCFDEFANILEKIISVSSLKALGSQGEIEHIFHVWITQFLQGIKDPLEESLSFSLIVQHLHQSQVEQCIRHLISEFQTTSMSSVSDNSDIISRLFCLIHSLIFICGIKKLDISNSLTSLLKQNLSVEQLDSVCKLIAILPHQTHRIILSQLSQIESHLSSNIPISQFQPSLDLITACISQSCPQSRLRLLRRVASLDTR